MATLPLYSRVNTILLACLHRTLEPEQREQLAYVPADTWRAVADLALAQDVAPMLLHRLRDHALLTHLPDGVRSDLMDFYRGSAAYNMNLYATLNRILAAFRREGIEVIVLKGAVLAEAVYGNFELRGMSDIDLLVPREQLARSNQILTELGFAPAYPNEMELRVEYSQHLALMVNERDVAVELHWTITTPGLPHAIDIEPLRKRAIPVTISSQRVLTFAPEDQLLHLCGHLSYQHWFEFGLRAFLDIDAVIEHYQAQIDWQVVVARTREWQWQRGVYVALRLAHELVGADIPSWVLPTLQPDDWDEALLDAALVQTFTDSAESGALSGNLADMQSRRTLHDKVAVLLTSTFVPRKQMALMYSVNPGSPKVFLYYPVRIVDLIRRYLRLLWRLWRGEATVTELAERKYALQHWLAEGK